VGLALSLVVGKEASILLVKCSTKMASFFAEWMGMRAKSDGTPFWNCFSEITLSESS
jgi:hypothetical protein